MDAHAETFPLVQPHPLTAKQYPEGLGVQYKVPDKAELLSLVRDADSRRYLWAASRVFGAQVFRCLDDQPFSSLARVEADICDPKSCIPFHVDVVTSSKSFVAGDSTRHEWWDGGTFVHSSQGLYQNPTKYGRLANTLISPTRVVDTTLRSELDPETSHLDEDQLDLLEASLMYGFDKRSPYARHDLVRVMAHHEFHQLAETRNAHALLLSLDAIERVLFEQNPQLLRVCWSDPELSRGGLMAIWDTGQIGHRSRRIVHARENLTEQPLPWPNLYRVIRQVSP